MFRYLPCLTFFLSTFGVHIFFSRHLLLKIFFCLLLDPPPFIFDDTDVKGSLIDELVLLRKQFWGQNRAVFTQSPTAEIIDLSSINFSQLNPLSVKILLVRKEYRIAYDALIADTTKQAGRRSIFLMTGQPGIVL